MFTGLVEDIGTLVRVIPQGAGARLVIRTSLPLHEVRLGDSIAVCGCCLTVVRKEESQFEAEISRETAARSTLGDIRPGTPLHLERAMRLSDRLDGHLVLGHVDGTGLVRARQEQGDSLWLDIQAPASVLRYVVPKGSIAVHGVSLTVNELLNDGFGLTLVPFTRTKTFLDRFKPGDRVNLEADLMGKYVERLLGSRLGLPMSDSENQGTGPTSKGDSAHGGSGPVGAGRGGLTLDLLAKGGFLER